MQSSKNKEFVTLDEGVMYMGQEQAGKKVNTLRYNEYYAMQDVFDDLYRRSSNGETFGHLMDLIMDPNNIMLAFRNVKGNKGSKTPGVDKRRIDYFARLPQGKFIKIIQNKLRNYLPKPVKRVLIPKHNGKLRPLGIPCMIDRIVQQCILQVLEPICEAKFHESSYGFRPFRSAKNAIAALQNRIWHSGTYYIIDVDIKGFFDNVDHKILRRQLWSMGIRDTSLLAVINKILKAPIKLSDGTAIKPAKGTPQGGLLSPLLANVVLNDLDWWIDSQWQGQIDHLEDPPKKNFDSKGKRNPSREYRILRKTGLKEMYIIRYADDFKICCKNRHDAEKILYAVTEWLRVRLHLEVSDEKTKITNTKRHYTEFLGIKIRSYRSGKKYKTRSHMTDKAIESAAGKISAGVDDINNAGSPQTQKRAIDRYNYLVNGLHNYYDMATQVAADFQKIGWMSNPPNKVMIPGLKNSGKINDQWIKRKHGRSKQMRWLNGHPIIPVAHVKYKRPMFKDRKVCKFTPEGRSLVHDPLELDLEVMRWFLSHPAVNESVAYNDNRLSRFSGQRGKCQLTGEELNIYNVECLHRLPKELGGTDNYFNLILVIDEAVDLIRSCSLDRVMRLVRQFDLSPEQIERVNKLRELANLPLVES